MSTKNLKEFYADFMSGVVVEGRLSVVKEENLIRAIELVSPKEVAETIIILYGLKDGRPKTIEQTAEILKKTPSTIKNHQRKAMNLFLSDAVKMVFSSQSEVWPLVYKTKEEIMDTMYLSSSRLNSVKDNKARLYNTYDLVEKKWQKAREKYKHATELFGEIIDSIGANADPIGIMLGMFEVIDICDELAEDIIDLHNRIDNRKRAERKNYTMLYSGEKTHSCLLDKKEKIIITEK